MNGHLKDNLEVSHGARVGDRPDAPVSDVASTSGLDVATTEQNTEA